MDWALGFGMAGSAFAPARFSRLDRLDVLSGPAWPSRLSQLDKQVGLAVPFRLVRPVSLVGLDHPGWLGWTDRAFSDGPPTWPDWIVPDGPV